MSGHTNLSPHGGHDVGFHFVIQKGGPVNPETLKKFPAQSYEEAEQICSELVSGGPATVKQLVEMVGDEFGDPKGVKPKYAMHGLVIYAARPGADDERKMVAATLAKELDGDHSDGLKAFICRQLQFCARGDEIKPLVKLLANDRLCEPATQALLAIGCEGSLAALKGALPDAEGKRQVTIRQAVDILSGK